MSFTPMRISREAGSDFRFPINFHNRFGVSVIRPECAVNISAMLGPRRPKRPTHRWPAFAYRRGPASAVPPNGSVWRRKSLGLARLILKRRIENRLSEEPEYIQNLVRMLATRSNARRQKRIIWKKRER